MTIRDLLAFAAHCQEIEADPAEIKSYYLESFVKDFIPCLQQEHMHQMASTCMRCVLEQYYAYADAIIDAVPGISILDTGCHHCAFHNCQPGCPEWNKE